MLYVGDNLNRLKAMLAALQYDTIGIAAVVAEAIAPVVITRLADDFNIRYEEALDVLKEKVAMELWWMVDDEPVFVENADSHLTITMKLF
jgi:hypothetical protein